MDDKVPSWPFPPYGDLEQNVINMRMVHRFLSLSVPGRWWKYLSTSVQEWKCYGLGIREEMCRASEVMNIFKPTNKEVNQMM